MPFSWREAASALLLAHAITTLALAATDTPGDTSSVFIVRLVDPPVAGYTGNIAGFPATAPSFAPAAAIRNAGKRARAALRKAWRQRPRLNVKAKPVKAFAQFLQRKQRAIAEEIGLQQSNMLCSFTHVSNGFAASLTPDQLTKLLKHPEVADVQKSARVDLSTTDSPAFMRLPESLWESAGGQASAGEDVVIGIIDTGIWPEHVSFANEDGAYGPAPPSFDGLCTTTRDFPSCNGKLVGARFFNAGFRKDNRNRINLKGDFNSPRDAVGHGTWCAGAAAGNAGIDLGLLGAASGIAPRARLASYKVFWSFDGSTYATTADIIAAINQAVADGVDVLSLSLGGMDPGATYFDDVALLNAYGAGVVVAYAAGNSGSRHGTGTKYRLVDNFAPWYLTVGASSISRVSTMTAPVPKEEEEAEAGGDTGESSGDAQTPPVTDGGAVTASSSPHVGSDGASTLSANAEATRMPLSAFKTGSSAITPESPDSPDEAPIVASFSSTGPLVAPTLNPALPKPTNDILKPDVIGPGVDLWAAAPANDLKDTNSYFSQLSGTSMATPHVAGLAALMMQNQPNWTPGYVMSAMMTTASVKNNRGGPIRTAKGEPATPWEMGSGHVNPLQVLDPGLVYNANVSDFVGFLAGVSATRTKKQFRSMMSSVKAFKPFNLNRANICVARLQGAVTVTRRVTNAADVRSTYDAYVEAPAGVDVAVAPKSFTIAPGETVSFSVTLTARAKGVAFVYGSLAWMDEHGHYVRSPIVVQPIKV